MKSATLQKAREFELEHEKEVGKLERPSFHLSSRIGWMNDPNGFVYFNGMYHLFYQYHPYSTVWGPMHWGHAVSKDLVKWEYLPVAIAPDSDFDNKGCFSGCGVVTKSGDLALIYTGVKENPENAKQTLQIQCLAIGDGENFTKLDKPIIDSHQIPAGCSIEDFRDPKVIQGDDEKYYLYVVNRNKEGNGQVLVYKSDNLKEWDYCNLILGNDFNLGVMWECPDLFQLNNKLVLMLSAQEVQQTKDFDTGNIGVCIFGKYDNQNHVFTKECCQQIDRGLDFYAQQTVLTLDNRRVMIGWMQNWDTCNYRTKNTKWYGQMSFPREIWIKNNRLYQQPVREIETYWKNKKIFSSVKIDNERLELENLFGKQLDMTVVVQKTALETSYFSVNLFEGDGHFAKVYYDFKQKKAGVDRKNCGSRNALLHERSCEYALQNERELKLRILIDNNSVEVFFGEGELAMSMSIYEENLAEGISFEIQGSALLDVISYEIKDVKYE